MKILFQAAVLALALAAALTKTGNARENTMDEHAIVKTIETMTTAFAAGDIDAVLSTYEAGAVVVAAPAMPVGGTGPLRKMFADFIAAGVNFTYGGHEVVVAGEFGLHLMKWSATGPNGVQTALSVAVLRRQTDGTWKMVIDHPFGDGVLRAK